MKDPLDKTKVVLRHLPPSISQSALMDQIDARFSGRYNWFSFRPGKYSQKNQRFSRAYIDFQSPEDVVDFAEFFDGHVFVNEKGTQFKALVEYAPSQHVPKVLSKKDGREGTIFKDPEYVEFLEFISKPVENLPSAEIQLERREAERAGGPKESVITTPLMDFIRQKRAIKSGSQRSSSSGKLSRRAGGALSSSSISSKRGAEKRRGLTSMYVLRDNGKTNSNVKDKAGYTLVSRKEGQACRREVSEEAMDSNESTPIVSGSVEIGKRRVVLLKGKEREASHVSGSSSQQQSATALVRNLNGSISSKQSQRQEASGRIIRSILSNKGTHQSRSYVGSQSEQQTQAVNSEREKRPPRPPNPRLNFKDHVIGSAKQLSSPDVDGKRMIDDKSAMSNLHGSVSIVDKNDRRVRNKDRPDRGVWTPRHSDGVHVNNDNSFSAQQLSDALEGISQQTLGHKNRDEDMDIQTAQRACVSNSMAAYDDSMTHGEMKLDLQNSNRRAENGLYRHIGRRGSGHGMKDMDGSVNFSEGKPCKRGISAGYGSHEKQVWVQKSGSGS
ncbi:uncharacterized protein A4U43_UnF5010 [Asparagus officinalis]|uniref:UPF3 domain-containing protein n=1 Tax=Asparagus officinalis TaxID=4686 RepID=A0A1R3L6S3_ASPOF|nr:regulator of nonsense transcripts UPF3-like [Asparagus officinalis]ONK55322.1 uncharacterized protein A4U43_UnF5010 [Asparagus officinalis]